MSTKNRINLAVSDKTKDRLSDLQDRMDSSSLSEVIRRAVELLDVVTEHQLNGETVLIRSPNGETEIKVLM